MFVLDSEKSDMESKFKKLVTVWSESTFPREILLCKQSIRLL